MTQTLLFVTPQLDSSTTRPQAVGTARRRHAVALAAAALLATPAAHALDIFTGNAPAFVGAWFNGVFTEVQQFQFALDWQGWCNAHPGSICSNHRYWNVAGNWNNNVVPGGASDVRVNAGDTVRVGFFNSTYLGLISGSAFAASVTGTGRVELYGSLTVGSGAFADLWNDRDNQGTLITTGLSTVSLLSSGAGRFRGQGGTTIVQAFTPSPARGLFEPLVGNGHTFRFIGSSLAAPTALGPMPRAGAAAALNLAPAGVAVLLEPTARFINSGTLDLGGGSIGLQGTANFAQLPTVTNTGTLQGSGAVGGVKFENQGQVQLGNGQQMTLGSWGEHSGDFIGGVGSSLTFAGIGSAGHSFAAGSRVDTLGAVTFGFGNHRVQGDFSAARVDSGAGGALVFDGPRPVIGSFSLDGGGTAAFRNAAGAAIQQVTVNGNFTRLDVETGAPLELQNLQLVLGSFNARAPVSIASSVAWSSGFLISTQPMTVAGDWQLLAGTRVYRANVSNSGNVSWTGGNFSEWTGRFTHQAGKQFDIWGDFNSAGGVGGKLTNAGTITKRSGTGRSQLAMSVDNIGGTVRALSGTLALTGGGTHTDATFAASAGAAIELAGGTTFGGLMTTSGRLNVVGGDFTLLNGTSYLHAAGNRFDVAQVRIHAGAQLSVADALTTTGSLTNLGRFTPSSHVFIQGDFVQQGSFALNPGKDLIVFGSFDNPQPLTVSDARLQVDTLINRSTVNIVGSSNFSATTLDNRGTLVLGPANGFPGVDARIGGVGNSRNSGTLRVDGAAVSVQSRDLQNTGLIANEGSWVADGDFFHTAGGRLVNAGTLTVDGTTTVFETAAMQNSGSLVVQGGALNIHVGAEVAGPGSFMQLAGVTTVDGRLQAGGGITIDGGVLKGTGTVAGDVTIGSAGQWKPGNSPGTMTVLGNAELRGSLEIEVATPALHDRLVGLNTFGVSHGSSINFVFAPGYVPQDADSDSVQWLSATGTNFLAAVNVSTSGLPVQWSAALSTDGRQLLLSNDLAVQIATRGSLAVPVGAVHFNALSSSSADYPLLDRLDNAGFFHNRAGASANVGGVLNNELGATLVNRGELYANTLNNAGQLNNRSGGTLQVATLINAGTVINQGSVQVINDFTNAEGAVFEQRGSMQLGGLSTNRGSLLVAGPTTYGFGFNNIGNTTIEATGSLTGGPGSYFWHSSGHLRVDGLLAADDIRVFGGQLSGNGRVQGTLSTDGDIGPGGSIGLLTVDGNLNAGGALNLEIASATSFDRLVVTGNASVLGGTTVYLLGSYRPTLGDSFSFLSVGGTLQVGNALNWAVLRLVDPADPDSGWTLWANADGIYDAGVPGDWRANLNQGTLSIAVVPEPGTWALWLAGLVAVLRIARRRAV